MRKVRIRGSALAGVAALIAVAVLLAVSGAARASNGTSVMEVRASAAAYGEPISVQARLRDGSTSCDLAFLTIGLSGCDWPQGRVDFYAVAGETQTFLKALPLYAGDWSGLTCSVLACSVSSTIQEEGDYCCLEPGSYTIRGYYVPGDFDPTSADYGPISVGKGGATPSFTQSSSTTWFGQAVTFDIHVQGSSDPAALQPTGFLSVSETTADGVTTYGSAPISNGNATITTTQLPAGTRNLHVTYSGDERYNSNSSDSLSHEVNGAPTQSDLTASSTSVTFGEPLTLTTAVSVLAPALGTATGSVTFNDGGIGGTPIGTAFLNEQSPNVATLTTSSLAAGSHTLQASYSGSHNFNSSTTNTVTVDVAKANTTTSLGSSANPSTLGQAVTFTASVTAPGTSTATGTIQFWDGTAPIGSPQALTAGAASLTIQTLAGGSHAISAVYSGSVNLNGSTGLLTQSVTCDQVVAGSVSSVTAATTGTTCLASAKVSGSVSVPAGAKLSILNSTIGGALSASSPGALIVCKSTFAGNVAVTGATGFLLLGNGPVDGCGGNTLKGNVTLTANRGGLALADNRISGGVTVSGNVGVGPAPSHLSPLVAGNAIGGFLACDGNSPAVTNNGRANTVKGWRSGECAAGGF
jgi:Big-like domain-containing protein